MRRRSFISGIAAAPLTGALPMPGQALTTEGDTAPRWRGAGVLRGGKGYAACPLGQLHYRYVGDGRSTPILLLHQTPLSMIEYSEIQPALATLGRSSLAVDNPSYGMSDPAPADVDMAGLADNLVPLLDKLGLTKVIVAGHHTGAAIAIAFAARHPDRTAAVISHGTPFYDPREKAERLARPGFHPALQPDGGHFTTAFKEFYQRLGAVPASLAAATWSTISDFIADADSPVYQAVFTYDMARDLVRIRAATLILSDAGDVLHENDKRAAALRPDFSFVELASASSSSLLHHANLWAGTVQSFAKSAAA